MKFSKEHIIEGIKKGKDREVLTEMYRVIYPKVYRYVTGNKGSEDDSKDVFQEAVLVFYRQVVDGKTDRITDITGFVIAVSRNIWINKAKRMRKEVEADMLEYYDGGDPNPLIQLLMGEKWSAYRKLFELVGEKCRELLTYSVYEKLSMEEIAVKMNLPNANAAKTQNYRCKQKLIDIVSSNKELTSLLKS